MWKRWDKEGNIKARQLAKEAISLDLEYGFPYAIMSWSHMNDVWFQSTESPEESMRLANDAIQKALALDDSDHRIQEALSNLYVMQGKHDEAITAAKRQMELCPGGAEGYQNLGIALDFACRSREAIPMLEKALVLDPFPSGGLFRNLASAYRWVEQYEDAIDAGKKALQINTNDYFAYFLIARSYARLGRKEEARAAVADVLRISPEFSLDWYAEIVIKTISKECQSDYYDEIEFLRKVDVGLK
jgi:tetratricopeptide (TPR) repeat protein